MIKLNFPKYIIVRTLKEGDYFGDIGVEFNTPRTAMILTKASRTILASIKKETYLELIGNRSQIVFNEKFELLTQIPQFFGLPKIFFRIFTQNIEEITFYQN